MLSTYRYLIDFNGGLRWAFNSFCHGRCCRCRCRRRLAARVQALFRRHNTRPSPCAVIRFFLLQNRAGKTRLAKYYMPLSDDDKKRTEDEVYRLIANRDAKFTNFLEVRRGYSGLERRRPCWRRCRASKGRPTGAAVKARRSGDASLPAWATYDSQRRMQPFHHHPPCRCGPRPARLQYKTFKVVYRRYAGLYFIFCVDVTDNELLYLETIHLFVEVGPARAAPRMPAAGLRC